MKLCISTLLLTIKVFLSFDEINASGVQGASSSSRPNQAGYLRLVKRDPDDGPPHRVANIGGQLVDLWLDDSGRHIVKAWYDQNCHIPQPEYFRTNDFVIRIWMVDNLPLVVYVSRESTLIGVRPPQQPGERHYTLEPTPTQFFLIHSGSFFKLAFEPMTQMVTDISLVPANIHKFWENNEHVEVTGLKFTVYRGMYNQITGAELGFQPLHADNKRHYVTPKRLRIEHEKFDDLQMQPVKKENQN